MDVFIYFNLHKQVFSIKSRTTNRVIMHDNGIVLHDATFKVSQAGRERVLRERRKNVHAGVQGTLMGTGLNDMLYKSKEAREATYNPYKYTSFVDKLTGKPLETCARVFLKDKRIWYWES